MSEKIKEARIELSPLKDALKHVDLPINDVIEIEEEGQIYVVMKLGKIDTAQLDRLRRRMRAARRQIIDFDEKKAAKLYREFAQKDRALAEAGMADYYQGLLKEDHEN